MSAYKKRKAYYPSNEGFSSKEEFSSSEEFYTFLCIAIHLYKYYINDSKMLLHCFRLPA